MYVEDDANDIWLLERAFRGEAVEYLFHVVRDGVEAIAWLAGDGDYEDRAKYPLPHLVLLDLKLPKVDGLAVLRWARTKPAFNALPVIIFSSSYHDKDITESYRLGANLFLVKPTSPDELRHIARFLTTWLRHSRSPPHDERMWQALTVRDILGKSQLPAGSQPETPPPPA